MKNNTQKIIDELKEKEVMYPKDKVLYSAYPKVDVLKAISKIDSEHKKEVEEFEEKQHKEYRKLWSKNNDLKHQLQKANKKAEEMLENSEKNFRHKLKFVFDELETKVLVKGLQMYNQNKFDKIKQKHTEGKWHTTK